MPNGLCRLSTQVKIGNADFLEDPYIFSTKIAMAIASGLKR